jgi:hypothetical protein
MIHPAYRPGFRPLFEPAGDAAGRLLRIVDCFMSAANDSLHALTLFLQCTLFGFPAKASHYIPDNSPFQLKRALFTGGR